MEDLIKYLPVFISRYTPKNDTVFLIGRFVGLCDKTEHEKSIIIAYVFEGFASALFTQIRKTQIGFLKRKV